MADPYRTGSPPPDWVPPASSAEVEGLRAEAEILRQANGALVIQVHELKGQIEARDRKITYLANSNRSSASATLQETKDLLRAALVFLKQAEKKAVFNRSQGVGEIISKIEGVPGVKDG